MENKDASEEEKMNDSIEILSGLAGSEKLTPEQQRAYNESVEKATEAQENNTGMNIDWNAVFLGELVIA